MTRTQATSILTGMLIAAEQAGITKHHVLAFGHHTVDLTIFREDVPESLDEVRKILSPLVPDGMTICRDYTSDKETEYLGYFLRFD